MIGFAAGAIKDRRSLEYTHRRKGRDAAISNLARQLEVAVTQFEAGTGRARLAPASFPQLAMGGVGWLKVGPYWIAHLTAEPPIILRIFHEASNFLNSYTR